MKKLLFLFLLVASHSLHAQYIFNAGKMTKDDAEWFKSRTSNDTELIVRSNFKSFFIDHLHIPWVVEYTLTGTQLDCNKKIARTNKFVPDPQCKQYTNLNKDYNHSGYDRGHNMPAEDNECSLLGMEQCFYFSNIYPQTPALNRGPWKELEVQERKEASEDGVIKVYIGWYDISGYIGKDSVAVPAYCWKVIYDEMKDKWSAYIFPNTNDVSGNYTLFSTTVKDIEEKVGVKFITK